MLGDTCVPVAERSSRLVDGAVVAAMGRPIHDENGAPKVKDATTTAPTITTALPITRRLRLRCGERGESPDGPATSGAAVDASGASWCGRGEDASAGVGPVV